MSGTTVRLGSRALVRVGGEGWRSFLNGLLTQSTLEPSSAGVAYAALLSPQGRILHDLFVLETPEGALLDVARQGREDLIARLCAYRLRAKVEIEPQEGAVEIAFGAARPGGEGWRCDPRLPELGFRRPVGPGPAGEEDLYRRRLLDLGVADPSVDARPSDYPIELNLDLLNAIDFKKGCFIGQETTSRMHRRGLVKTRLMPLRLEGARAPPVGAEVTSGDRRAGEVRTAQADRALALMRLDRLTPPLEIGPIAAVPDPCSWLSRCLTEAPTAAA